MCEVLPFSISVVGFPEPAHHIFMFWSIFAVDMSNTLRRDPSSVFLF